jgi:hypothetical protein
MYILSKLIKQKYIVITMFLILLSVGISTTAGRQFFSAYGQADVDDLREQSDLSTNSSSVINETIPSLDNMTNTTSSTVANELAPAEESVDVDDNGEVSDQNISETNVTDPNELAPAEESVDVDDNGEVSDQNISETTNDQQSVVQEPENQSKDLEQQNLGDQNSSGSPLNMSTSPEVQLSNDSQPIQNITNASATTEQDDQQQQQVNDTSGTVQLQPETPQENLTEVSKTSSNVTNATSTVGASQVDLLNANTTQDQPLAPETPSTENVTGTTGAESNLDTLDQITPSDEILGNQTSDEIDTAATDIAGISNATSTIENNQISNIQNVINNIALSSGQSGGNAQQAASTISKEIQSNPKGPVATAIKTLAGEYSKGSSDEINIAAKQIGTLIAKGNNIQQTLVQVTNKVVNNIQNIKTSIENYDKIVVHPKTSSKDKTVIQETINVIKKSKTEVDVPRVHIKFHDHERNLVLRVLSTNNYKYEMAFSKYNGAFILDDNEFRVKIISGDGSSQSASVAKMFKSGKVGDRVFLDKDVRKGKVYFSLDDIHNGKYLLEVYVKLSNGAIGTFARGSVSIK